MVLERLLQKRASLASDVIGGYVGDYLTGPLAFPTGIVGQLHGLVSDIDPDEVKQMEKAPGTAFFPGVGSSRIIRRQRAVDAATGDSNGTLHRWLGSPVNLALLSILGAGAGAILDSDNRYRGAAIGLGAGAGTSILSQLAGAALAGGTKHRNIKDHKKSHAGISNYLVPGMAGYETLKTLGTSEDLGLFPNKVNVKG